MIVRYSQGEYHGTVRARRDIDVATVLVTECSVSEGAPPHSHDMPYMGVVLAGRLHEAIDGKPSRLIRPMVTVFHPLGEEHAMGPTETGVRSLGILLKPAIRSRLEDIDSILERPFELESTRSRQLVGSILNEVMAQSPGSDLALESHVVELVGEAADAPEAQTDLRPQPWLRKARNMIRDHNGDGLSLTDIAREVGIHPVHLAREFRRFYGCTPGEYLRIIRVQMACSLLVRSRLPLAHVAERVGFYDQAHFTRVFKTYTGLTPNSYRKTSKVG
ncbi:MAG: helix-turn-helix domain-containing protein [Fimbriimonadaceae bacterium]